MWVLVVLGGAVEGEVRTGGCLCGAIRYSVSGDPLHVRRCHCADCRKESGSAFSVCAHWPVEVFEMTGLPRVSLDGCQRCHPARSLAYGLGVNSFQCPSETSSTPSSVTLIAVWSSIAYAGFGIPAAHRSASAMELSGKSS